MAEDKKPERGGISDMQRLAIAIEADKRAACNILLSYIHTRLASGYRQ